jgi:Putative phage metallopeptidase
MSEKLRAVKVELIQPGRSPYRFMEKMRKRYHPELKRARIALAWRISYKPDREGHLVLGKCHKASDLQRELSDYDYVILLNKEVWNDSKFSKRKKYALMDHEMCHAAPVLDKKGRIKKDDRGRYCWRMRDHDVEEFYEVVKRHGKWKRDLELFAKELLRKRHKK